MNADAIDSRYALLERLRDARRDFHERITRDIETRERVLAPARVLQTLRDYIGRGVVSDPRQRCSELFVLTVLLYGALDLQFAGHGIDIEADVRGLRIYDATCPLVTKVHVEVAKMRQDGVDIVMIGHKGHPEVEGTMGQVERGMHLVESVEDVQKLELADPERIALVTQTTLSVDDAAEIIGALKSKYPKIREPKKQDICYATQNRQDAVKFMAPQCDVVIVVGSPNSSNSSRLREVAEKRGVAAYMVDAPDQIDPAWVAGKRRIGVTAGASAPEVLAQAVIARLRELGVRNVRALDGIEENVSFPLPRGLNLPPAV